jgi:hypothetical protein
MTQELTADVYELSHDLDRFETLDWEYDLEISQTLLENVFFNNEIRRIEPLDLPNPIVCEAEVTSLQYIDYPSTNFYLNGVMSKRMLEVLQSVKPFACRTYPIVGEDFITNPKRDLAVNTDFVAVQLTEYADVFDYENSTYSRGRYAEPEYDEVTGEEKWFVSKIKKLVLKKPKEGYPPIFRIREYRVALYISNEARQALKKAKITGVEYLSLQGHFSNDIDFPVKFPDWDTREAEWRAKTR